MLIAVSALLLGACAAAPGAGERRANSVNLAGFPPEYRQAFAAGCDRFLAGAPLSEAPTGKGGATLVVVQGWRDGYDSCRRNPR